MTGLLSLQHVWHFNLQGLTNTNCRHTMTKLRTHQKRFCCSGYSEELLSLAEHRMRLVVYQGMNEQSDCSSVSDVCASLMNKIGSLCTRLEALHSIMSHNNHFPLHAVWLEIKSPGEFQAKLSLNPVVEPQCYFCSTVRNSKHGTFLHPSESPAVASNYPLGAWKFCLILIQLQQNVLFSGVCKLYWTCMKQIRKW